MALAETARLIVELALNDKLSPGINRATTSLTRLQRGGEQVGHGMRQVAGGLARVGVIAGGALAGGIVAAAKVAGDFEAQLNTINTIAKESGDGLQQIGEGIRETFRETGQPLEDLTAGYYDLLSAGIKTADAQGVLNQAVKLGIGGLGSTAEAVDLLTTAINAYGLDAEGAQHATDSFAAAVRDGKVKISELAGEFAVVAPLAANLGVGIDEINATVAFLTAKGNTAGESLTQMRSAMVALQRQTPEMKAVLKELGIEDVNTTLAQDGLAATFDRIRAKADEMGIPIIKLTGRVEGMNYVLQTTGKNADGFAAEMAKIRDAAGETEAQFSERQKGLNYQLGRLKALAQDAGITIGNALLPKLVPMIEKLNTFISTHQEDIAKFGEDLAASLEKFAQAAPAMARGLGLLATVGKKVVDIFLSLPPGIQTALVTGAAINKLSGGLIGSGLGNIIGGGAKIATELIFRRGQTPATPLYVQQVGGLGPGGGLLGGSGTASAILRSLGVLGLLFGAAEALKLAQETFDPGAISRKEEFERSGGGFFGLDPFGQKRTQGAATPQGQFNAANAGGVPVKVVSFSKAQLNVIDAAVAIQQKQIREAIKAGDLHTARIAQRQLDSLNDIRGVVPKRINDLIPHLGRTNRALAVANRNLQNGNQRQREIAERVRDARDRIGTGFQRANEQLGIISRKQTSFEATVVNNITATLSTYQSLQTMTRVNRIRTMVDDRFRGSV